MIRISVNQAVAAVTETETLTAGRVGLKCGFTFTDSAWSGLSKVAVFEGAETLEVVLGNAAEAVVPPECMETAGYALRVGVYGMSPDNGIVIPTIWAKVGKIRDSAAPDDGSFAPATPDVVAQIIQTSNDAIDIARRVEAEAAAGEFDGVSPTATVTKSGKTATVTITDRDGTTTAALTDGASAYEQAVAGGYVGSEEAFNTDLAAFKDLATQSAYNAGVASDAAGTATTAASSASASATGAAGSASSAGTSAGQAAASRNEAASAALAAQTAATTATGKATQASASASSAADSEANALAYKNAAAASATAAGESETAAEAAQTGAEAAQAAAEAVLESIPEDYSALSADVETLETAFDVTIGAEFHGLPEGYTEKAYLENSVSSLVNTGVSWSVHPRVVIDVFSTGGIFFGNYHTSTKRLFGGFGNTWYYGSAVVNSGTDGYVNKRVTVDYSDTALKIDGVTVNTYDATGAEGVATQYLRLFGQKFTGTTGSSSYAKAGTRIYRARFYKVVSNVETLVFDGIPCVRDSDGEAGFYDLVGGTFLAAETGSLKAGEFENLQDIAGRVTELEEKEPEASVSLLDGITFDSGHYWNSEAGIGGTAVKGAASGYYALDPIPVSAGDAIHARLYSGGSSKQYAVLAVDDDLKIISRTVGTRETFNDFDFLVPAGATKLLLTTQASGNVCKAVCRKTVPVTAGEAYTNASWAGAKVSVLGDSFTAIQGYCANKYYPNVGSDVQFGEQMWWKIVCNELGMSPLQIRGWSGSCVASGVRDDTEYKPSSDPDRCEALHSGDTLPDVVLIAMGVNDYSYSESVDQFGDWDGTTALGSESDLSDYDNTTFRTAYATMIARIQHAYPEACVVAITPFFQMRKDTDTGANLLNEIGKSIDDYAKAVREICGIMHVPCIDGTNIGFNRYNYYPTYAKDSATIPTHPTVAGQKRLGLAIAEQLKALRRFGG